MLSDLQQRINSEMRDGKKAVRIIALNENGGIEFISEFPLDKVYKTNGYLSKAWAEIVGDGLLHTLDGGKIRMEFV